MFKIGDQITFNYPFPLENIRRIHNIGIVVNIRNVPSEEFAGGIDVKWQGAKRIFYNYKDNELLLISDGNDILKGML